MAASSSTRQRASSRTPAELRALREQAHCTQGEWARLLNAAENSVYGWENGTAGCGRQVVRLMQILATPQGRKLAEKIVAEEEKKRRKEVESA